ncbi:hypothetical protein BLNAU_9206 [Blattamonas nauphoetae]|uniref:Uncharacterized protein n=1 Tax=Blattamonas nauphoetae TaxID=2049346 RepID=A0ABQ9XWK2_9EUKA|nr:hypothetical protein BLNAU_9206 [Blattamonas nauphoetae]
METPNSNPESKFGESQDSESLIHRRTYAEYLDDCIVDGFAVDFPHPLPHIVDQNLTSLLQQLRPFFGRAFDSFFLERDQRDLICDCFWYFFCMNYGAQLQKAKKATPQNEAEVFQYEVDRYKRWKEERQNAKGGESSLLSTGTPGISSPKTNDWTVLDDSSGFELMQLVKNRQARMKKREEQEILVNRQIRMSHSIVGGRRVQLHNPQSLNRTLRMNPRSASSLEAPRYTPLNATSELAPFSLRSSSHLQTRPKTENQLDESLLPERTTSPPVLRNTPTLRSRQSALPTNILSSSQPFNFVDDEAQDILVDHDYEKEEEEEKRRFLLLDESVLPTPNRRSTAAMFDRIALNFVGTLFDKPEAFRRVPLSNIVEAMSAVVFNCFTNSFPEKTFDAAFEQSIFSLFMQLFCGFKPSSQFSGPRVIVNPKLQEYNQARQPDAAEKIANERMLLKKESGMSGSRSRTVLPIMQPLPVLQSEESMRLSLIDEQRASGIENSVSDSFVPSLMAHIEQSCHVFDPRPEPIVLNKQNSARPRRSLLGSPRSHNGSLPPNSPSSAFSQQTSRRKSILTSPRNPPGHVFPQASPSQSGFVSPQDFPSPQWFSAQQEQPPLYLSVPSHHTSPILSLSDSMKSTKSLSIQETSPKPKPKTKRQRRPPPPSQDEVGLGVCDYCGKKMTTHTTFSSDSTSSVVERYFALKRIVVPPTIIRNVGYSQIVPTCSCRQDGTGKSLRDQHEEMMKDAANIISDHRSKLNKSVIPKPGETPFSVTMKRDLAPGGRLQPFGHPRSSQIRDRQKMQAIIDSLTRTTLNELVENSANATRNSNQSSLMKVKKTMPHRLSMRKGLNEAKKIRKARLEAIQNGTLGKEDPFD